MVGPSKLAKKPAKKPAKSAAKKPKSKKSRALKGAASPMAAAALAEQLQAGAASIVSVIVEEGVSKGVAVHAAVSSQLARDGRWPPKDLTRVMNAIPYRYSAMSMRNFLDGVETSLRSGLPRYVFTWDSAFVNKALPLTVAALMAEIELATK